MNNPKTLESICFKVYPEVYDLRVVKNNGTTRRIKTTEGIVLCLLYYLEQSKFDQSKLTWEKIGAIIGQNRHTFGLIAATLKKSGYIKIDKNIETKSGRPFVTNHYQCLWNPKHLESTENVTEQKPFVEAIHEPNKRDGNPFAAAQKNMVSTPATVLKDLRADLRLRGGIKVAATRIGSNASYFSRIFAQGRYLTAEMAGRLADGYGYERRYLSEGIGKLMVTPDEPNDLTLLVAELQEEISSLKKKVPNRDATNIDYKAGNHSTFIVELKNEISFLKTEIENRNTTITALVELLYGAHKH